MMDKLKKNMVFYLLLLIIEHKLPTVLSTDEIDRLLDATDDLKYKG